MKLTKVKNNEFEDVLPYLVLGKCGDIAVLWGTYGGNLMYEDGIEITDFTQFKEIYEIDPTS